MKKFLSLAVAALLTISAVATSATAAKFTDVDVKNDALNDAVELLTALNVTKGTSETTFGTDENVTRQQMAAFIYRMMKAGKSVEGGTNTTSFTDLDDSTFFFMISWASSNGIIKGRSATEFDPKGGIVLQDAYTMIVRALGYDDGTLAYPIGYISIAEDLGLDENLPSTLGYADTLTRGDVAIILANMFYAETAEVEIVYESEPVVYCPVHKYNTGACDGEDNCNPTVVSGAQTPKEVRKTVAEKVFEVEKISQRVVATPNYSFEGQAMPDEDVEMLYLTDEGVDGYADYKTSIDALEYVEFAALGLEGSADDYFLHDIVMFVRENDGEIEIFGATATGTKTTVSFEDVKFGTVSGTAADKYYDGEDKEYKIINGKLTLGDTVTYLFEAPFSYTKGSDIDYTPEFITLGAWSEREVEEDVVDVNFNYVLDEAAPAEFDESIIGTYSEGWTYDGYLSQVYFGGLGEIDVYDCDNDGKVDYLFVKNYTVGTIDTEEDEDATSIDLTTGDGEGATVNDAEDLVIYTDMAIVEGVEFADKDVVLAYVAPEANYVKVAEVLAGTEATVSTTATDYFVLSTGEKVFYQDAMAVVANGEENLDGIELYTAEDFDDFDTESTYYFTESGKLVFVTGLATGVNLNENWVVVLSAEAIPTTTMVDNKLETAHYVEIYNDGEIKTVKAKKITASEDDKYYEDGVTPATYAEVDGVYKYTFADYTSKLATGKADKKGAYYFELFDFTIKNDSDALTALADDEEAEYRKSITGSDTVGLVKKSGTIYTLDSKDVYVRDYTQIIIRSLDEEGEEIVTLYGADNLPDIKEGTAFAKASYILTNNLNSKNRENLVVFYGEAVDSDGNLSELKPSVGKVADVRIVKSSTRTSTDEGTIVIYDVFNPVTGETETGIESAETGTTAFAPGAIVGLTTEGYIDNTGSAAGNVYESNDIYDTADRFSSLTTLGFVEVDEYDATEGFLTVIDNKEDDDLAIDEFIYQITDDTVVTFSDKSDKSFSVVGADALASTGKTYRQGENKNNKLRVFLCVEEDKDASEEGGETFYDVLYAVIVRD